MLPTIRVLLFLNLLGLVCVTVVIAVRSTGDPTTTGTVAVAPAVPRTSMHRAGENSGPGQGASQRVAAQRETPIAPTAAVSEPSASEETAADDAAKEDQAPPSWTEAPAAQPGGDATVPADTVIGQRGPLLLPFGPPYLNQPIEDETPVPASESTSDETAQEEAAIEETESAEDQAEEPAEEVEEPAEEGEEPIQEELSDEAAEEVPDQAAEEALQQAGETPDEVTGETPGEEAEETPDEEAADTTTPEAPAPAEPEPKPVLTPEQAALRDRVRRTLAVFHRLPFNIRSNTATEVMHLCLAFGCETELYHSGSSGKKVNGVTCLCWNYPCAGYVPLGYSEGRIAARIGYGLQERPGQLLAVLALARVPPTYPARVDKDVRTVADLVESEKLSCRSGTDLSLKLIALTYYASDEPDWKNDLGEAWSIERIVKEELARPMAGIGSEATRRLMGLGYALDRRAKCDRPIDGEFLRAKKFLEQYQDYVLKLQNSDGSWGRQNRTTRGTGYNRTAELRTTGHVLQWLAVSLPEDKLEDPRVVRSVEFVNRLLGQQGYRNRVSLLTTEQVGLLMRTLHALVVYDDRFFTPRTPRKPLPEATEQAARTR